jgi:hypothetical protein
MGEAARSAAPAIRPLLEDPDPKVKKAARTALEQVDPKAAEKKG